MPRIVIRNARLSYAYIWETNPFNGDDPKYTACLLIDKNDHASVTAIREAINQAVAQGHEKFGTKYPQDPQSAQLQLPLHDGDIDNKGAAYDGHYFLNAKNKNQPQIVDAKVQPILDQSEVYSGCYANVSVTFYPFIHSGNKGVAVSLGNIQKIADGENLAGGASAKDEFSVVDSADDDFLA